MSTYWEHEDRLPFNFLPIHVDAVARQALLRPTTSFFVRSSNERAVVGPARWESGMKFVFDIVELVNGLGSL